MDRKPDFSCPIGSLTMTQKPEGFWFTKLGKWTGPATIILQHLLSSNTIHTVFVILLTDVNPGSFIKPGQESRHKFSQFPCNLFGVRLHRFNFCNFLENCFVFCGYGVVISFSLFVALGSNNVRKYNTLKLLKETTRDWKRPATII